MKKKKMDKELSMWGRGAADSIEEQLASQRFRNWDKTYIWSEVEGFCLGHSDLQVPIGLQGQVLQQTKDAFETQTKFYSYGSFQ